MTAAANSKILRSSCLTMSPLIEEEIRGRLDEILDRSELGGGPCPAPPPMLPNALVVAFVSLFSLLVTIFFLPPLGLSRLCGIYTLYAG